MKTKPDDAIHLAIHEGMREENGLTKREYFAAMAMQSLVLRWQDGGNTYAERAAQDAIEYADALIEALNKGREPQSLAGEWKVYSGQVGQVVQIKSDEWYVWKLDIARNDGTGFWAPVSAEEMIEMGE